MSDLVFFEPDNSSSSSHHPALPADDFDVPAQDPPYTIYYLTITTPHTDSFNIHGPEQSFKDLIPHIMRTTSDSPSAINKIQILRKDKAFRFDELGFKRFVIELERGTWTVLEVLREDNRQVHDVLPSPVYVITAHGPLAHDMGTAVRTVASGRPRGLAKNSRIVGAWVDIVEARDMARGVMEDMLRGEEGSTGGNGKVMRSEKMETGGRRRWMLLAMSATFVWEVRVHYEDEGLMRVGKGLGVEEGWRWRC